MKLSLGDVCALDVEIGVGYLQLVGHDPMYGEIVKVVHDPDPLGELSEAHFDSLVQLMIVCFPVKTALRRGIVTKVASFDFEDIGERRFVRLPSRLPDGRLTWEITDRHSGDFERVSSLTEEQVRFNPAGIVNDTWIIDWINDGGTLENWEKRICAKIERGR